MRRIIISCLCLVLLLGLAVSASAVAYGWEDYVTAYGDDRNGNPFAECLFPNSMGRINVYNGNTWLEGVSGGSVTLSWSAGQIPRFRYLPFGQQGISAIGVGKLALKWEAGGRYGIPNGTHLYFDLEITASASSLSNATITSTIIFYDSEEAPLSEVQLDLQNSGSLPYVFAFDYVVDAPINAYYMAILIDMRSNVALTSSTSIGMVASDLWMRGDGLEYVDWRVSGEDVEDIKDAIYDKFDPIDPDDVGPEALPGLEEDGRDQFKDSVEHVNGFYTQVLDGLSNYTQAFLFVSALISACLDIFALKWLVYFSASIGFACMILGIVPQLVSRNYERSRQRTNKGR